MLFFVLIFQDVRGVNGMAADSIKRDTILIHHKPEIAVYNDSLKQGYVKTNLLPWLLLESNVAVEFDMGRHISFNLPIYFSGIDWISKDWKFRIFGFQPGIRYWLTPDNQKWFVGFHLGVAWYNMAFGGDYRYQDKERHTPAIGAGLSAGYRMPISDNRRWWLEAEIGFGVYSLNYNRFVNEKNGALIDSRKKTAVLPDIVSLTIGYRFQLEKGGSR